MSAHPAGCRVCRGSGYEPGSPITEIVQGRRLEYTTVQPCSHDWWHDDTGWNPHDEALGQDHPRAAAAMQAGYAQGQADQMCNPEPGDAA